MYKDEDIFFFLIKIVSLWSKNELKFPCKLSDFHEYLGIPRNNTRLMGKIRGILEENEISNEKEWFSNSKEIEIDMDEMKRFIKKEFKHENELCKDWIVEAYPTSFIFGK